MDDPRSASKEILWVRFKFEREVYNRVRSVAGSRWHADRKAWSVPDTPDNRRLLGDLIHATPSDFLLASLGDQMRLRGFSPRTQRAYAGHMRRLLHAAAANGEDPARPDVLQSQLLRLIDRDISRSYVAQAVSALRFFCRHVLRRPDVELTFPYPTRPARLPAVLSRAELRRFLAAVTNAKHRALLLLIYSAGLRVSEAVRLCHDDIDRERSLLRVREGKGLKERYTLLSEVACAALDAYSPVVKSGWLFPGPDPRKHLSARTVQHVVVAARERAEIRKRVTVHTLRHCFATHLLEGGTDLRFIQKLLGHASVRTTEIYAHVTAEGVKNIRRPLDSL